MLSACSGNKAHDTLIEGGYDKQEMEAAIARARNEVDSFIAEMSKGNGTNFAVKVAIKDEGETEHFWLKTMSEEEAAQIRSMLANP